MKKIIAIICCLVMLISLVSVNFAHADALTASMVASASYALMSDWGITFTAGSATGQGVNTVMSGLVTDYVNSHGGSFSSLFVGEMLRTGAGKLLITHELFNGIKNFVDWLKNAYDLSSVDFSLSDGSVGGLEIDKEYSFDGGTIPEVGIGVLFDTFTDNYTYNGYKYITIYNNGAVRWSRRTGSTNYLWTGQYYVDTDVISSGDTMVYLHPEEVQRNTGVVNNSKYAIALIDDMPIVNSLSWNGSNFVEPTVLNPGKAWVGEFGEAEDTNLDQLLGEIDGGIAQGDLDITYSEVIDYGPAPTPHPTTPPAQDVLGGINELIGQQDQVIEGIDSLEQTVTDAAEAAQEAAEAIEEGLDVVSDQEASTYKFDLSTLFPFCIPFDIVRMLRAFDGIAEAPRVQIPFVIQSLNFSYLIDLDFSAFDPVAAVLRQVELIAFGIALAYVTSKVIRW